MPSGGLAFSASSGKGWSTKTASGNGKGAKPVKGGIKSDVVSLMNASKNLDIENDANYFLNNTGAGSGSGPGGNVTKGGKLKGFGKSRT